MTRAEQEPNAARGPRPRRRRSFLLAAVVLGLAVGVLTMECAFRLFWTIPPAMAGIGHAGLYVAGPQGAPSLTPGFAERLVYGSGPALQTTINSLGMRGPEVGATQADELRVLVVGDSLPFGYGVCDEDTFPAHLQTSLRAAGVNAVVGNGGIPGTGVSHAVTRMAALDEPFSPDVFVICSYLGNDAMDEALPQRAVYGGLLHMWPMCELVESSWRTRLAFQSRLAMWAEVWIFSNYPAWSPLASIAPSPSILERVAGLPPQDQRRAGLFLDARDASIAWAPEAPPVIPRLMDYLRAALARAKRVAGERPVLFLILPDSAQIDPKKRSELLRQWQWDAQAFEPGLAQRRWQQVAESQGLEVLDVTPLLAKAGAVASLFLADGGHLSPRGNALVGGWIAAQILDQLRD